MTKSPQIGMLLEASTVHARAIYSGVFRFVRNHRHWQLHALNADEVPAHGAGPRLDGIIGHFDDGRALESVVHERKIPTVNLTDGKSPHGSCCVACHEAEVGRVGARHYLDQGLKTLVFCDRAGPGATTSAKPSQRGPGAVEAVGASGHSAGGTGRESARCRGFIEAATKADAAHHVCCADGRGLSAAFPAGELGPFLSAPGLIGLMAFDDELARTAVCALSKAGIAVPEKVAVLGAGNDDLVCELTEPTLSSVVLNAERIGYEAATVMARLLNGHAGPVQPILIEPLGVALRRSSLAVMFDDPAVTAAAQFIHRHAGEPLNVGDVLDHVGVARRSLERRFQKCIGRTLGQEILRVRLDLARRLLVESGMTVDEVAAGSGFRRNASLSVAFRQATGMSPLAYRKRHRVP